MATPVRNPDNAQLWIDAAVYASASLERPTLPATADAELPAGWELPVGILDGKAGFEDNRSWKSTDHTGWGIGVFKVSDTEFGMTRTFTALEDNEATRALLWPGSTATKIVVPRPAMVWLCFEATSDTGKVERLFTNRRSRVWTDKVTRNEEDITALPFECRIFADSEKELVTRQVSAPAAA